MSSRLELPFRPLVKVAFFEFRVAQQVSTGSGIELAPMRAQLAPGWFIGDELGFADIGTNLRLTLSRLEETNRRTHRFLAAQQQAPAVRAPVASVPKRITPKMASRRAIKMMRSAGLERAA